MLSWTRQTAPASGDYVLANGQRLTQAEAPDGYDCAQAEVAAGNPLWTVRPSDLTFTVPDLRDKFLYNGPTKALGATGGEENHLLLTGEAAQKAVSTGNDSPDHTHGPSGGAALLSVSGNVSTFLNTTNNAGYAVHHDNPISGANSRHQHAIAGSDATTAHNNMPPYCVLAFYVKVRGVALDGSTIQGPPGPAGPVGNPSIVVRAFKSADTHASRPTPARSRSTPRSATPTTSSTARASSRHERAGTT